jgi:hypothetical protein
MDRLDANLWVAIYGDLQSGKTQLAAQVARDFGSRVLWVRMDGLETDEGFQISYPPHSVVVRVSFIGFS